MCVRMCSQNKEGYWDLDAGGNGLAFALLAHRTRLPKAEGKPEVDPETGMARLRRQSSVGMTGMMAAMFTGEDAEDAGANVAGDGLTGEDGVGQCPVTGFDQGAIYGSVPEILRRAAAEDGSGLPVERIWTTLLAVRMLASMYECFLLQARSSTHDGSIDETVVDRAMGWLQTVAGDSEPFAVVLDELLAEADACVKAWRNRQAGLAGRTQAAWTKQQSNRNALDTQRVAGSVAMALRRNHDTFSALLAPATGSIQRWQQLFLVVTALMGMLTVVRLVSLLYPFSSVCIV